MPQRFTLQYRGKRYQVERGQRPSDRWYITVGGAAVTSLDVRPREAGEALRKRVRGWLEAHPELDGRDRIHLGGG
jgi:hypothetical protein